MATVECPICDVVFDMPELVYETGPSGVAIPTVESIHAVQQVEAQLLGHVEADHDTKEVLEAFRKADVYIARLEDQLAEATVMLSTPSPAADFFGEAPRGAGRFNPQAQRVERDEPNIPLPPAEVMAESPLAAMSKGEYDDGYVQPDKRTPVRDPALGPGQRPEGVVARR